MAVAGVAFVPAAQAAPDGSQVVISEAYGGGGNSGGLFDSDFIELHNPTGASINLGGLYLHAGSTGGSSYGAPLALSGTIPAHGYWLVKAATGGATTQPDLPTPDQETTWAMSGTGFRVSLQTSSSVISVSGNVTGNPAIVDYVGVGAATAYEGAAAGATTNGTSVQRNATGADTNNNAADFTVAAPAPQNSGSIGDPEPGTNATVEEIQGTATASPRIGQTVTTTGIVTGAYPTGGLSGFYLQQPNGTDPNASDGVFVYKPAAQSWAIPAVGDQVTVTGAVSEFNGLTEVTGSSLSKTGTGTVTPVTAPYPTTDAAREALEGMLVRFTGDFTVTDNYSLNRFGEIALAAGDRPLWQPTEVADAQNPAAVAAVVAENASKRLTLDDGASIDYMSNTANKNIPLPWLTNGGPIRVGAPAQIQQPMVLDYRFDLWRLQPTTALTGSSTLPVSFGNSRTEHPAPVGGDVKIATFNVLNYFPTTGQDYVNSGHSCSFYNDRAGNPIAVNDCGSTGPRGAADAVNLDRQEKKIVAAINGLGADVISLEELENSAHYGPNRDAAISRLVDALNAAAGAGTWAYVPTPSGYVFAGTDVIRNGFIYKPAAVQPVGESRILDIAAFDNARGPG